MNFDNVDLVNGTLMIKNEDGSVTCIPEDGATAEEQELFTAWRGAFPNGRPSVPSDPIIVEEPVDEEKVAMAEAIIDLESRLSQLEVKINA